MEEKEEKEVKEVKEEEDGKEEKEEKEEKEKLKKKVSFKSEVRVQFTNKDLGSTEDQINDVGDPITGVKDDDGKEPISVTGAQIRDLQSYDANHREDLKKV